MSIFGSVLGSVAGLISSKKTNKIAKKQQKQQQALADQQIKISDYIQNLSKELMAKGSTAVDPYGGRSGYDPATGTYTSTLGEVPRQLQSASDAEELTRYIADQALRRQGLNDAEGIRASAARESGTALTDLADFRRGIGTVDPVQLAARMRLDRQGAVNAGYDDAERSAQTLQLRTGSSAVADALSRLARRRVDAQAQVGDPEVEALQLAEGINTNRLNSIGSRYTQFADRGSNFYDAAFSPSTAAATADAKTADAMKFDLSKYDLAQGGSGVAGQTIGNAAAGLRQGNQQYMNNRIANPWGQFIASIDKSLDGPSGAAKGLASLFG